VLEILNRQIRFKTWLKNRGVVVVAVVVKEEAGEVTAVPLKARAKHKVF
jgi:hypothetical protein